MKILVLRNAVAFAVEVGLDHSFSWKRGGTPTESGSRVGAPTELPLMNIPSVATADRNRQ